MAKKRRSKRSRASRRRAVDTTTSTMSSDDSYALHSARQSSDGAPSLQPNSSAQTSMTSIMDTDEDRSVASADSDSDDGTSTYPASQYPGASSLHKTDIVYYDEASGQTLDLAASTRSIWAQDLDYRNIHGRRYCRDYYMPNDEMEQLRLALCHQVFLHVLDGELTTAPLDDPKHILDIGTGTGEWAIKMAELYSDCEVVGTDISAIAETSSVPMNVFFEIDDAEDWDRPQNHYDLIHFRYLEGAFKDWPYMYESAFYSLKPGGWIEVMDFDTGEGIRSFVSQFAAGSPMHSLLRDLDTATAKAGRNRGIAHMDPRILVNCGFVDIRSTEYVIPITIAESSVGKIWLISCLDAMEAMCLRPLTEEMGWDPEKCKAACESTAREMAALAKDPVKAKDLVVKMRVIVARKPVPPPRATRGNLAESISEAMES